MTKLAVCDLTGLFIDEVKPIAKELGFEKQYREMSDLGRIDFSQIEKYLNLLSAKPQNWVASQIKKAKPLKGSRKAIKFLKKYGYRIFILTDDVLMSMQKNSRIIKEKLDTDKIIATAEIKLKNKKYAGLKNIRSKPQLLRKLIKKYSPESLICMVQGINDYNLALSARKHGGTVISVNSHSLKLENMSDYHIDSISEAPKLLERILYGAEPSHHP